jgi:hypothetical protein
MDVEGAEVEILSRLPGVSDFKVVLLEYHSDALRRECDAFLKDYILVGAFGVCNHSAGQRGTLKYLHQRLFDGKSST